MTVASISKVGQRRPGRSLSGTSIAKPETTEPSSPAPVSPAAASAAPVVELNAHLTADAELAERRAKRKPFGSRSQKLAYPARPGFHRHWFNDWPGRIIDALDAGYAHVQDTKGTNVKRPVGVNEDGSALIGVLMEIPEEWYQEDMAAQQARVDELDSAIRSGSVQGRPGEDGRYIPSRGIHIGTR